MNEAEEVEALAARCAALETVWKSADGGTAASADSVRRIARSVVPALEMYGSPELVEAARRVEGEPEADLERLVPSLIAGIREIMRGLPREAAHILVVESDLREADRLRTILGGEQREVQTAASIDAAREILSSGTIDLVVLSLDLEGSDGRDLLVDLLSRPATSSVPRVVLTRDSDDAATRAECFALGADELLEAPVEPHILSAAIASLMRRRAVLTRMAQEDHLTGLPNRAAFARVFMRLQALAHRNGEPLTLALLDVDFLKEVNDRRGHQAGDRLLQSLARVVEGSLRDSDVLARWGGDEFAILLPRTGSAGAREALDKARRAFRRGDSDATTGEAVTSFSAGVTGVRFTESVDEAVARADELLYRAKTAGRDSVVGDDEALGGAPAEDSPSDVLLVEDEDSVATVLSRFLEAGGFGVRRVARGDAALTAAHASVPDLVVLDIKLPGKNGFEVLGELRSDARLQDVPVLILTALGHEGAVVRGFSLGVDEYLVKPVSRDHFMSRVRRLVRPGVPDPGSEE